jgi:hypothetical protein
MILSLCDVPVNAILEDYETGIRETNHYLASHANAHEVPRTPAELDSAVASARSTLTDLLGGLDVGRYLLDSGCSIGHLQAIRMRLLQ